MKVCDMFNIYSEDHKYTEEYIYNHKGTYPIYSATLSKPYGYCDSFKYDETIILVVNYGDAGKTRVVSGKFNIGRNVTGLSLKKEFIDLIDIYYVSIILEKTLLAELNKGNMGCISQHVLKNTKFLQEIPLIAKQKAIVKQYKKLEQLKTNIFLELEKINNLFTCSLDIDKGLESKKVYDIFNIYGGNSGLTESVIYNSQSKLNSHVKVISSSVLESTQMGYIDRDTKIGGKLIKTFNKGNIVITRNGDAGKFIYINEPFTINDHAYVIEIKEQYKKELNMKYFMLIGEKYSKLATSMDGSNATFSKSLFEQQNIPYPFPSIEEQNAIVELYDRLSNIKIGLENILSQIPV